MQTSYQRLSVTPGFSPLLILLVVNAPLSQGASLAFRWRVSFG